MVFVVRASGVGIWMENRSGNMILNVSFVKCVGCSFSGQDDVICRNRKLYSMKQHLNNCSV